METISAVYVRMNILLEEMGTVSARLSREISDLRENMERLHISWEGKAYEEYHRVLMEDLSVMELKASNAVLMYQLLKEALTRYQVMETKIGEAVGGLAK